MSYEFQPSLSFHRSAVWRSRAMKRFFLPRLSLPSLLSLISSLDAVADAAKAEMDLDTDEVPKLDVANCVLQWKQSSSSWAQGGGEG